MLLNKTQVDLPARLRTSDLVAITSESYLFRRLSQKHLRLLSTSMITRGYLSQGFLGARMFGSLDWSSFVNGTLILTRVGLNPINPTVLLRLLNKLGAKYDIVHVGAWSTAYAAAIAMGRRSKREWATDGAKYVCHALYHAPVGYNAVPAGNNWKNDQSRTSRENAWLP